MKVFLVGIASIGILGFGSQSKIQPLDERLTLDYEVGSISGALEAINKSSDVSLRVVGPAINETVYLHVKDRPVKEVMDEIAKVTHAEWSISTDGAYTLKRVPIKSLDGDKNVVATRLKQLEEWRTKCLKSLNHSYQKLDIEALVKELRTVESLEEKQNTKRERESEAAKESNDEEKLSARRQAIGELDPMSRAMARIIKNLDLRPVAAMSGARRLVFASYASANQLPLPSNVFSALDDLRLEQLRVSAELQRTKKAIPKEDGDQDLATEPAFLPRFQAWEMDRPLKMEPAQAFLIFTEKRNYATVCELIVAAHDGTPLFSFTDLAAYYDRDWASDSDEKKIGYDIKPSNETLALWSLYNQTEEYEETKPSPEALKTLEDYFRDPIGHDILRLGNQELLIGIGEARQKSVIACIPDSAVRSYMEGLSIRKFLEKKGDEQMSMTETTDWVEAFPKDYPNHWRRKVNRQALATFAHDCKNPNRPNIFKYIPTMCGELGFEAESDPRQFLEITDDRNDRYEVPNQPAFIHLFNSFSHDQIAAMTRGQIVPYAALSQDQLKMISKILFSDHEDMLEGGKAPNLLARIDSTCELPNGLLTGAGIGASISFDDICVAHYVNDKKEDRIANTFNFTEKPETVVVVERFFGCGMRSVLTTDMTFDMRKQKRITLKCFLTPKHYFAGDFAEPLPAETNRISYARLPKDIEEKLKKQIGIVDASQFDRGVPPPKL